MHNGLEHQIFLKLCPSRMVFGLQVLFDAACTIVSWLSWLGMRPWVLPERTRASSIAAVL